MKRDRVALLGSVLGEEGGADAAVPTPDTHRYS
jgi:hypothetical protein